MIFKELLGYLKKYSIKPVVIVDSNAQLYGFMEIQKNDKKLEENILYVAQSDDLKKLPDTKKTINILYFGNKDRIGRFEGARVNIAVISDESKIHEIITELQRKNAEDMRRHDSMRILTEALFDNRGTQHILDAAHRILRNPLIAIGRSNNYIQLSYDDEDIAKKPILRKLFSDLEQPTNGDPLTDKIVEKFLLDKATVKKVREQDFDTVVRHTNSKLKCEQLSVLIRVKGIEVGKLVMLGTTSEFDEFDEKMFYRLSRLFSQELQKKSLYTKNRNEVKAQFVNYLLTSKEVSSDRISRFINIDKVVEMKDRFYVTVIQNSSEEVEVDSSVFDLVTEQLKPILVNSLYLVRDTELVILFNLPKETDIRDVIDEPLYALANKNHLVAGVSNPFSDLKETKKFYEQAKKAANVGTEYPQWTINYFSIIAPIEMFHVINRYDDLKAYIYPTVLDLLEYDRKNNSNLTTTLYVYLDNFGNTAKSAELLYIHKNTLLYRMQKIKEILHCELESGEEILRVMMSLRIIRVLGLYDFPKEYAPKY
ncbi:MAG: helix-turn-helix domain-containing protein [Erysipelotrichaceae bacterium]|nr:helix-turn-helix domain-containing protein [Erysipelotrichaceae bacterium]